MKGKTYVLGGLIAGLFLGHLIHLVQYSEEPNKAKLSIFGEYGTLIFPILDECPLNIKASDYDFIEEVITQKYDRNMPGLNSHEFLVISHTGSPNIPRRLVYEKNVNCSPNTSINYTSWDDFIRDFGSFHLEQPESFPVYIKIFKGHYDVNYHTDIEY